MTDVEEKQAKILIHPGIMKIRVDCDGCRKPGLSWIYSIFLSPLSKAKFYCEDCRQDQPRRLNIDTSNCPELTDRVIFPTGLISWHTIDDLT